MKQTTIFDSFTKLKNSFDKLKMTKKKLFIILGVVTALILGVGVYFALVPINFCSEGFRTFIFLLLGVWCIPLIVLPQVFGKDKKRKKSLWQIPVYVLGAFVLVNTIFDIATAPLFMSGRYRGLISVVDNHSFTEDIEDYQDMQIPVVDKYLAEKLGDKKLGEDNLGSQFSVGEYYMIFHKTNLFWIAPIEFNGFFPWVNRQVSPGYVLINALDPADVKIIKHPLRYVESAFFHTDLNRENYFRNMTAWRANDAHLELTDEGEPRFVETVYTNTIGYTSGRDIKGIIVTNPDTGESEYYDYLNAPKWINHVLTEELVVEQLNYWGEYVNGFFNSIFAKSEVLNVSTGINYVYSNGDMYLQTGMTSVGSDESIVGVMMVNMRTKESFFYRIGGATEYAAAQSAIGKDQEKRYSATDPIMINLSGVPTYFLMLKDDEGLVKRYAYVNVSDYRIVTTADTMQEALSEYKKSINVVEEDRLEERVIKSIEHVLIDGNSYYYILFERQDGDEVGFENIVFKVALETNDYLPFIKAGDKVKVVYEQNGNAYLISHLETVN
ncbi:MAG: hypothetical protein IJW64_02835 [Clostridia bacterium]|nr:hypothetical protein [Clostridia bacterium]